MEQHAASCYAHIEASVGSALPGFIKDEFGAFLDRLGLDQESVSGCADGG